MYNPEPADETMNEEELATVPSLPISPTHVVDSVSGGDQSATVSQVLEKIASVKLQMEEFNSKVSVQLEQLEQKLTDCLLQVEKAQGDVEQVEGLSQTVLMLYQESTEEIRNLQSGFHELGNKSYEKSHSKNDELEKCIQDQVEKNQKMNEEWSSRFETMERELQNVKRKQGNAILDAIRSALECMVCLDAPNMPLFVCPNCAKMIGCFQCSSKLDQCVNCRASLPSNKQPLKGLDALTLILNSSTGQT